MEQMKVLNGFFERAINDPRIGKAHVSAYMALFNLWCKEGCPLYLSTFFRQIMPIAKISSSATIQMTISDLNDFGYIRFTPSNYKKRASQFQMITFDVRENPIL